MKKHKYNITYLYNDDIPDEEIIRCIRKGNRRRKLTVIACVFTICAVIIGIISAMLYSKYDKKVRNYCELERSSDKTYYSVVAYSGSDTQLYIPSVYKKRPIADISDGALRGNDVIERVVIPETVERIGAHAFSDCVSLKGIEIPEKVTRIASYTFSNCSMLEEIVFLGEVTDIEEYAFYNCASLVSITLPSSVTSIGTSAFEGCSRLYIVYEGTEDEWYAIEKAEGWDKGLGFYIVYCDDVMIFVDG